MKRMLLLLGVAGLIPLNIFIGFLLYDHLNETEHVNADNSQTIKETSIEIAEGGESPELEEVPKGESNLQQVDETVQVEIVENDSVEQFQSLLHSEIKPYYQNWEPIIDKPNTHWVGVQSYPATDFKYDIQKTNSLVSPYQATVEFELTVNHTEPHATREEVELDKDYVRSKQIPHKLYFSWQDGKWVTTSEDVYYADIFDKWVPCSSAAGACYPLE